MTKRSDEKCNYAPTFDEDNLSESHYASEFDMERKNINFIYCEINCNIRLYQSESILYATECFVRNMELGNFYKYVLEKLRKTINTRRYINNK